MAVMGLRLAQRANGVSKLHGEVSRSMFAGLWPGFDAPEVPITSVTNGVHAPTWVAPGGDRPRGAARSGDELVEEAQRLGGHRAGAATTGSGPSARVLRAAAGRPTPAPGCSSPGGSAAPAEAELGWIDEVLDPDVLTIGFARRVPSYKRLTLMLRDPERLTALLLHPERPVQIVVAGKAHPADDGGKQLIQELVRFADDPASGTGSSSCPTTTWRWRRRSTRAATCGSTTRCARSRPAAPPA